ncbi:HNH endonuclease signature motif containing protein [Streptomyces sp. W16]|uniref:HNH endonuclease n=1 Tax=Streptomyces sp. W16 TaxID=3076631 RepID=UPI00295B7FEE|nr:HNH endonuclease signature motif containing protein [Streptomyces sp. W16]MDV9172854.1 HNH endonuclease signature motif containing protein [Streptomyces sp. W16]
MATNRDAQWIQHEYLDTYRIASLVETYANSHINYLRELEALTLDCGICAFIPHWQKDTALHKFIRYAAEIMLEDDNSGKYKVAFGGDPVHPKWTLPLEEALVTYGIQDEVLWEIPEIAPVEKTQDNGVIYTTDAPELRNACYEYFQEMQMTQVYNDLLHKISDEVFFVMFTNRVALQNLHQYLAYHVLNDSMEYLEPDHPQLMKFYTKSGRMRRTHIPMWARRAIFFRDRGICTKCKKDISGLLNPFSRENYDHIVPLAEGGLNDVTNLQLLCESCNNKKSARLEPTSKQYQRWF